MTEPQYGAVEAVCLNVTERAVRVKFTDIDEIHWVPRSIVADGDQLMKGDDDIRIATWWLRQVGIST